MWTTKNHNKWITLYHMHSWKVHKILIHVQANLRCQISKKKKMCGDTLNPKTKQNKHDYLHERAAKCTFIVISGVMVNGYNAKFIMHTPQKPRTSALLQRCSNNKRYQHIEMCLFVEMRLNSARVARHCFLLHKVYHQTQLYVVLQKNVN